MDVNVLFYNVGGLFQGDSLSPIFFFTALNPLMVYLEAKRKYYCRKRAKNQSFVICRRLEIIREEKGRVRVTRKRGREALATHRSPAERGEMRGGDKSRRQSNATPDPTK